MGLAGFGTARRAEEHGAERFRKTGGGEAADQRHRNDRNHTRNGDRRYRLHDREKTRIEQQEFADESVQRGQANDRRGAY